MADESIWKKEISFGRKRKEPVEDASTEQDATGDEATSVWKKELSFGRKQKQDEPAETPDPVVADAPLEEEEPTWTRAVSFARKSEPAPPADEEPTVVAEPAVADEPELAHDESGAAAPVESADVQVTVSEPVVAAEAEV